MHLASMKKSYSCQVSTHAPSYNTILFVKIAMRTLNLIQIEIKSYKYVVYFFGYDGMLSASYNVEFIHIKVNKSPLVNLTAHNE
jgi:hypothetical protein